MRYRLLTLMPQFSIRDLLWLLLLAAVICLAYRHHRVVEARAAEMMAQQVAERTALQAEKTKYSQLSSRVTQFMDEVSAITDEITKRNFQREKLRQWRPASDEGRLD